MKTYKTQNTKTLREAFWAYCHHGCDNLFGLYKTYSADKARAWAYCAQLCKDYNGHDLRAIAGNSFSFSAGFWFDDNGKTIFCYITKASDRFMIVD